MGERGPAKKPTSLIRLNQNAGHHIKAELEGEPTPEVRIPDCPDGLLGEAKREWFRITKELYDQGLVTELDVQLLKTYCINVQIRDDMWSYIRKCKKFLDGGIKLEGPAASFHGRNSQTQSEYNALKSADDMILAIAKQFGLSPSSRSRLKTFKTVPAVAEGIEGFIEDQSGN